MTHSTIASYIEAFHLLEVEETSEKETKMVYTTKDVDKLRNLLAGNSAIKFHKVYLDTLGGADRASIMITISFDDISTWKNMIFENSRGAKFTVTSQKHKLVQLSGLYREAKKKFRKCDVVTVEELAAKLIAWAEANQ
jgi:hypothetical protein